MLLWPFYYDVKCLHLFLPYTPSPRTGSPTHSASSSICMRESLSCYSQPRLLPNTSSYFQLLAGFPPLDSSWTTHVCQTHRTHHPTSLNPLGWWWWCHMTHKPGHRACSWLSFPILLAHYISHLILRPKPVSDSSSLSWTSSMALLILLI